MRNVLLGTLVGFALMGAAHADDWVVEAHFPDQAALQRASRHFEHVIVDRERNLLRVDTTDAGIAALEAEGLEVTIDTVASAKLNAFYTKAKDASRRGVGLDGIPGYECFRTRRRDVFSRWTICVGPSRHRLDRRDRPDLEEDAGFERTATTCARCTSRTSRRCRCRSGSPEVGGVFLDPRARVHAGRDRHALRRVARQQLRHRSRSDLARRPQRFPSDR